MRLLQIRYYLAVAECKSITKAAERLYISQPALSKHLALLEEEIGVKLVNRQARGIELTEAGEYFFHECQKILSDLDRAVEIASAIGRKNSHVFRIGCFEGSITDDFLPMLYHYLRSLPGEMQIKLMRQTIGENKASLNEGKIDILIEPRISFFNKQNPEEHCKILCRRKAALIYSDNSPLAKKKDLSLKDFKKERLILPNYDAKEVVHIHTLLLRDLLGVTNPEMELAGNFMTFMTNIELGAGYGILSCDVVNDHNGLHGFLLPEKYGIDIVAVWKTENVYACSVMENYT